MNRIFAGIVLASLLVGATSSALPKFASRTGLKCQSCHINPTGKGMRNEFGRTFGQDEIVLPTFKGLTDLDDYSTSLTPNIGFGGDFRELFFYEQNQNVSSFFQMQGDMYLDLRLNKKFLVYFDKGLYTGFEVFGMARVLPLDGYIKVGKFMPAYGTRIDDHTYFIRGGPPGGGPWAGLFPTTPVSYPIGLPFGERSEDTGLELGFFPGIFSFNVGLFNGEPGGGLTGETGTKYKAVALRGDATFKLGSIPINFGGSIYNLPGDAATNTYYGVFGSITALEKLTLNSEVDYLQTVTSGRTFVGVVYWDELNYMAVQGLDLKLAYEFYDPDNVRKNGSFSQVTVGAEIFVLSGVELRPLYRINMEQPTEVSNNEFQMMFHFYI